MCLRVSSLTRAAFVCVCVCAIASTGALTASPPSSAPSLESDALSSGESLYPGQGKTSSSGQYSLTYQGDGNLVLYDNGSPIWHSDSVGSAGQAAMQGDGNFVLYDSGGTPVRTSNTAGFSGAWLAVQNDGNVVIYSDGGTPLWDRYSANWSGGSPPQNKFVLLVNGSFAESPSGWTAPGSPEYNAIQATYGVAPNPWPWTTNEGLDVVYPYNGIWYGAYQLANYLASLPAGEVNIVSHSHGGNVVLASQYWSGRQIRRYIQLATPVNFDFGGWRYALGYTAVGRCQVSSASDWIQFAGASDYQIFSWAFAMYASHLLTAEAYDAYTRGDYWEFLAWAAAASFAGYEADQWFFSTKIEVEGGNQMYWSGGLSHSDMHEPFVWYNIPSVCK